MTKACASPSGRGWTAYSIRMPSRLPSPSRARKASWSAGVVMISTSRTPAIISVESG